MPLRRAASLEAACFPVVGLSVSKCTCRRLAANADGGDPQLLLDGVAVAAADANASGPHVNEAVGAPAACTLCDECAAAAFRAWSAGTRRSARPGSGGVLQGSGAAAALGQEEEELGLRASQRHNPSVPRIRAATRGSTARSPAQQCKAAALPTSCGGRRTQSADAVGRLQRAMPQAGAAAVAAGALRMGAVRAAAERRAERLRWQQAFEEERRARLTAEDSLARAAVRAVQMDAHIRWLGQELEVERGRVARLLAAAAHRSATEAYRARGCLGEAGGAAAAGLPVAPCVA